MRNCQICGNEIKDLNAGRIVAPFGEACGDCVQEIQTIKEFQESKKTQKEQLRELFEWLNELILETDDEDERAHFIKMFSLLSKVVK